MWRLVVMGYESNNQLNGPIRIKRFDAPSSLRLFKPHRRPKLAAASWRETIIVTPTTLCCNSQRRSLQSHLQIFDFVGQGYFTYH